MQDYIVLRSSSLQKDRNKCVTHITYPASIKCYLWANLITSVLLQLLHSLYWSHYIDSRAPLTGNRPSNRLVGKTHPSLHKLFHYYIAWVPKVDNPSASECWLELKLWQDLQRSSWWSWTAEKKSDLLLTAVAKFTCKYNSRWFWWRASSAAPPFLFHWAHKNRFRSL